MFTGEGSAGAGLAAAPSGAELRGRAGGGSSPSAPRMLPGAPRRALRAVLLLGSLLLGAARGAEGECRPGFVGDKGRSREGEHPRGKGGGRAGERLGAAGAARAARKARLGSSLRRVPPRQRRVLPRQPASGLRRRPVPQLADGAERPRRRAPGRWVRARGPAGGSGGSGGRRGRADGPAALWQSMRTTTAVGTRTATPRPGATSEALPGPPSGDPATSPSAQVRVAAAAPPTLFLPSLACPLPRGAGLTPGWGPRCAQTTPGYASTSLGNSAYPGLPSPPPVCAHLPPSYAALRPGKMAFPLVPEKACEKPPAPRNSLIHCSAL